MQAQWSEATGIAREPVGARERAQRVPHTPSTHSHRTRASAPAVASWSLQRRLRAVRRHLADRHVLRRTDALGRAELLAAALWPEASAQLHEQLAATLLAGLTRAPRYGSCTFCGKAFAAHHRRDRRYHEQCRHRAYRQRRRARQEQELAA